MKYLGFDWDETNQRKLATHDLTPEDVEEPFERGRPIFVPHPTRSDRVLALGFVPDGRFVLAAFEYHAETRWVRVVTAYEAEQERWWARYWQKTAREKPRK